MIRRGIVLYIALRVCACACVCLYACGRWWSFVSWTCSTSHCRRRTDFTLQLLLHLSSCLRRAAAEAAPQPNTSSWRHVDRCAAVRMRNRRCRDVIVGSRRRRHAWTVMGRRPCQRSSSRVYRPSSRISHVVPRPHLLSLTRWIDKAIAILRQRSFHISVKLERCNPCPHFANRHNP